MRVPLGEVVQFNPKPHKGALQDDSEVSFVPMAAVEAGSGRMDASTLRPYGEVKKGFTYFADGDVLFAKITPCMENGKSAVAAGLHRGVGFGSTEFHVLRPTERIDARYLYQFVAGAGFRREAAHHMTGAVGQKRVPVDFLRQAEIPLPGLSEQRSIVAEIEKQFSRLDEAVANLRRVKANLARFRGALISEAVGGRLTDGGAATSNGWHSATLGSLTSKLTSGSRDWSPYYGRGESVFVLAQNVRPLSPDFSTLQHVDPPAADPARARSRIQRGDLLVTIVGANAGQACMVDELPAESFVCQSVALIRPTTPDASPFLNLWLNSPDHGQRYFAECMYGQGRPHLGFDQLAAASISLPSLAEQRSIVAEVDRRLSIVRGVEAEVDANLKRAQTLRQAVLSRAFQSI